MDNYYRRLKNVLVKDGDTVSADIDLGFNCKLEDQDIRLYGVNAYETTRRGSWDNNLTENEIIAKITRGKEAKNQLINFIKKSRYVYFQSKVAPKKVKGKYGRWLGILWLQTPEETINFNKWLVENDYGFEYFV